MMMKKPLVSIITPCFNSHSTIMETIRSVKNQSYQNIEHIVIDDGSTEPIKNVIQTYLSNIIFLQQDNMGVSAARNNAVKHAQGEILVFLDADDLIDSTYIEKVVQSFELQPNIAMVACYVSEIGRSKNKIKIKPFCQESFYYHNNLFPSIIAVSKVLFEKVQGYNENLKVCEDWDLYLRISQMNAKVHVIPEYLFFYRKHKDLSSLTDLMGRDKDTVHKAYYSLYQTHQDFYDQKLLSPLNVAYLKIKSDKRVNKVFKVLKFVLLLLLFLSCTLLGINDLNMVNLTFNILIILTLLLLFIFIVRAENKLKKFDIKNIPHID